MQKSIYIVLSRSGTIPSKIIGVVTHEEYSHVSLALTEDLNTMYSFGRIYTYSPFWGGFVVESPKHGVFKRFKYTKIRVLKLNVTNDEYNNLYNYIRNIKLNKDKYLYNYIGVFLFLFGITFKHKNWLCCCEFVHDGLVKSGIITPMSKGIVTPESFLSISNVDTIYTGLLTDYKYCGTTP